jgi:acetyl esterase/lipase
MRRLGDRQGRRPRDGVDVVRLGPCSIRIHRPTSVPPGPAPALLWIHGGGFVIGTAAQDDRLCAELASTANVVVAAVDYRLAPEHPFPIPLDDCHDALVWLARQPDVDEGRIAIGGGSAGGGLAAGLALLARDRGEVRPVFQLLSYPMLDDRTSVRPEVDDRHCRLWNHRSNRFGWSAFLGREPGRDDVSERAAPARSQDLSGLPPAWIGVGSVDLFEREDVTYAEALRTAGGECDLVLVDGAFHGFDSVRPGSGIARDFRAAQARSLQQALSTPAG